ncbi:hypothetical protein ACFXA8_36455, partial [Streptomyces sp. NPDC059409]
GRGGGRGRVSSCRVRCLALHPWLLARAPPPPPHAWGVGEWARLAAESGADLAELTGSATDTADREVRR